MERQRKTISAAKAFLGLLAGISMLLWIQSKNVSFKLPTHEVFEYIEEASLDYKMNPDYVFALALGQSQINPKAEANGRRGVMLISQTAWAKVSPLPYDEAFEWQTNIDVTLKYLDYMRAMLKQHGDIDYSHLTAAYLHGIEALEEVNMEVKKLGKSKNPIIQRLLDGQYDLDK